MFTKAELNAMTCPDGCAWGLPLTRDGKEHIEWCSFWPSYALPVRHCTARGEDILRDFEEMERSN